MNFGTTSSSHAPTREETDGMVSLARAATDRISSNIGPLDLGEDAVQTPERRIAFAENVSTRAPPPVKAAAPRLSIEFNPGTGPSASMSIET